MTDGNGRGDRSWNPNVIGVGLGVIGLLGLYLWLGPEVWSFWRLPVLSMEFGDLRTITHAGVSLAEGHDPLRNNPGSPWGQVLNYPRIWLLLPLAGVTPAHTEVVASVFCVAFVSAILLIASATPRNRLSLPLLLTTLSPATLLGIERGNTDIFIFALCVAAALALGRTPRLDALVTPATLLLAAVLKLYPAVAFGTLALLGGRRTAKAMAAAVLLLGVYLVATWSDLLLIWSSTPRPTGHAFGSLVLPLRLAHEGLLPLTVGRILARMALAGIALAAAWLALRMPPGRRAGPPTWPQSLFVMGATIYLAVFVAGSSYEYRLVFLIATIPWLSAVARGNGASLAKRLAVVALGCLCFCHWHLFFSRSFGVHSVRAALFVSDHALHWVLSGCLLTLLAALLSKRVIDCTEAEARR